MFENRQNSEKNMTEPNNLHYIIQGLYNGQDDNKIFETVHSDIEIENDESVNNLNSYFFFIKLN